MWNIGRYNWHGDPFTTLVDNGRPSQRFDIAILGDGYSPAEIHLFEQDVDVLIQEFRKTEPIATYWQHFNFHRVNIVSTESGCCDKYEKVRTKSPLGSHFSFIDKRRLVGWDWRVWQVAKRAKVPFDGFLVIVNTPRRGGACRFWLTVGYASRNSADYPAIMVHEAGHALAKLNDEYVDELFPKLRFLQNRSLPNLLPFANTTTNAKKPVWKEWIDEDTTLPTPLTKENASKVGAFEGASYSAFGVYRPTPNCMMRWHSQPFCPVCQEQWIKRIYKKSTVVDSFAVVSSANVGVTVQFTADLVRPDKMAVQWEICPPKQGWMTVQATDVYLPLAYQFPIAGEWQVRCTVRDASWRIRKTVVQKIATAVNVWNVSVT